MANDVYNAAVSFSDPGQFVQMAGGILTQGGPQALAAAVGELIANGRPDLANNLATAADIAATVNGRPDIKAFIEGGGLQSVVASMLGGGYG